MNKQDVADRLGVKDTRVVSKIADALGLDKKNDYTDEEVSRIEEAWKLKKERKLSYKELATHYGGSVPSDDEEEPPTTTTVRDSTNAKASYDLMDSLVEEDFHHRINATIDVMLEKVPDIIDTVLIKKRHRLQGILQQRFAQRTADYASRKRIISYTDVTPVTPPSAGGLPSQNGYKGHNDNGNSDNDATHVDGELTDESPFD
jgi:hypothetical protein